ncbi:MAG: tetratricopeptide repeat protein [Leptolyngbya sp. SIO1D8]|nr:tetratricopeptide repeat protein [Leptolyngbya sp. SIO1D8]
MELSSEAKVMTRLLQSWLQSQQGKYLLRRGMNLMQQGNVSAAIATFTDALSKHAQPEEAYLKRGIAYWQQEAFDTALADFEQVIALCPQDARAYNYRGLVRYQLGDEAGALDDWAIALQHQPNHATVRYNRGLVHVQRQQYEEALVDFDIALDQNPLLAEAYLHRGKVKHQLGDMTGAVKDWELALCNDLRLEEAHHLLVRLRQDTADETLCHQFLDLLPEGCSVKLEQQGSLLMLSLHRAVGTPINYFKFPNVLRERLIELEIPEARRFRLVAKAGDSSLAEWDQTYSIYDKAPCPPTHWRAALATTLLLFPPFGIIALVYSAQVRQAYKRGDYPIAARASHAAKKLCLSSGAIMGLMLFGLASYGVYTHVEIEYPNPSAKTALISESESSEDKL